MTDQVVTVNTLERPAAALRGLRDTGAARRPHWAPLDGLRGIAILMVVTIHFWAHSTPGGTGFPVVLSAGPYQFNLERLFRAGAMGVPMFFVLSGFLLWYPYARAIRERSVRQPAAMFLTRRVRRIMPAFLFFSGVYLLAAWVFGKNAHGAPLSVTNILCNLLFLAPAAYPFRGDVTPDLMPGTWSLTPEIWFYALLPVFALLSANRVIRFALLTALLLIGTSYRWYVAADPRDVVQLNPLGCIHAFAWGMLAAYVAVRPRPRALGHPATAYVGAALLITSAAYQGFLLGFIDPYSQVSFATALIILSATTTESLVSSVCNTPVLRFIGRVSYSLFLCHIFVVWYVFTVVWRVADVHPGPDRFAVLMTFGLAACIGLAAGGYELVERPWLEEGLKSYRLSRGACAAAAACGLIATMLAAAVALEYRSPGAMAAFDGRVAGLAFRWAKR